MANRPPRLNAALGYAPPMPRTHALRDLLLLLVTAGLWSVERSLAAEGGVLAAVVSVVTGLATALCGYLVHEWGHLAAARRSRSVVELPHSAASVFLFRFDVDQNQPRQFVAMSCGGFLATALVVPGLLVFLPAGSLATSVALALTALGVFVTLVAELPPFFRVLGGGPLPRGAAYRSAD